MQNVNNADTSERALYMEEKNTRKSFGKRFIDNACISVHRGTGWLTPLAFKKMILLSQTETCCTKLLPVSYCAPLKQT